MDGRVERLCNKLEIELTDFSKLSVSYEKSNVFNGVYVSGYYIVSHNTHILEEYLVEIIVPLKFPEKMPIIRELGGKIPNSFDRHKEKDNALCIMIPEEFSSVYGSSISFIEYLNKPVRNYFLSQLQYEIDGSWPWGCRSHGMNGLVEFYNEKYGLSNEKSVKTLALVLSKLGSHGEIKYITSCVCGSGRYVGACHIKLIGLRKNSLPSLKKYAKKKNTK